MNLVESTNQKLIFVESKKVEREGKSNLHFVKLANPATFENYSFFADKELKTDSLQAGDRVKAVFAVSDFGGRSSLSVVTLSKEEK